MKHLNGLSESLNKHLNWHKTRMNCFSRMLLALIAVKTVNLQEIAVGFSSDAQISSRYRRLQKFFAKFEIDFAVIGRWLFTLYFAQQDKYYLIIDRTNWYWGRKKINVLMLSVAYEGQAIPLFWHLLDKGGDSNFEERKALLYQFIEQFGVSGIEGLLADREFGSGQFFRWLTQKKVPFYIRIKEGSQVCIKNKKLFTAKKIFRNLNAKTDSYFGMAVEVFDAKVFLAGSRSERGELMIVATNRHVKTAIAKYLRRWEIENLFQSLKGRGFRFEQTHITDPKRIAKLMALLAIAFAWAHKVGEWRALRKPIYMKKFRSSQRPQYSFFSYGLELLRESVLHITNLKNQLLDCIQLLQLPALQATK